MRGRVISVLSDTDGNSVIQFRVDGALDIMIEDIDYDIQLKKYYKKRSLDANAYMWVLINKISKEIKQAPKDIYVRYIRELGGNYEVVPVRDDSVSLFTDSWSRNGDGWVFDTFPSKLKDYTNVRLYYGSSVYDCEEMRRLIDNVIEDCRELNIEVATPDEVANMISLWGSAR